MSKMFSPPERCPCGRPWSECVAANPDKYEEAIERVMERAMRQTVENASRIWGFGDADAVVAVEECDAA